MARIKKRKRKSTTYLYVYSSVSLKGEKKTFEKLVGKEDDKKDPLNRKIKFYSKVLDSKKELYLTYLEIKNTKLKYLPEGYAFPLVTAKCQYHQYLSKLYPNDIEKYKAEFEIRYVYNTTSIEGNTLTLQETAMVLDKGLSPKTKELREIHEVENYRRLRNYVKDYNKDITFNFICKIHEFIQRNIDDDSAGFIRRIPVGIQGSEWEPPPAIVVKEELEKLLKWYKKNKTKLHSIELGGIFHHKFLQIHPFNDGNGRVARELLNFILEKNDYPPIIVPTSRGLEYFESLTKADKGNIVPLLKFLGRCIMEDYVKALSTVKDEILLSMEEFTGELTEEESEEIIKLLTWYILLIRKYLKKVPKDIYAQLIGFDDNNRLIDMFEKLGG
jgi:fido (protein-threonine AMPylation protein)